MRYVTREKILILCKDDLINFTNDPNADSAFSIYKNVCVIWDDDFDHRVLDLIDGMPAFILKELFAIQEHKGGVCLLWQEDVPSGYEQDVFLDVPDDTDSWVILRSIAVW